MMARANTATSSERDLLLIPPVDQGFASRGFVGRCCHRNSPASRQVLGEGNDGLMPAALMMGYANPDGECASQQSRK
jgi:hypothetical protein